MATSIEIGTVVDNILFESNDVTTGGLDRIVILDEG